MTTGNAVMARYSDVRGDNFGKVKKRIVQKYDKGKGGNAND